MKENINNIPVSLLHETESSYKKFFAFIVSFTFHLFAVWMVTAASSFLPGHGSDAGFYPSDVIDVSMVTLPEQGTAAPERQEEVMPEPVQAEPEEKIPEPEEVADVPEELAEEPEAVIAEPEKPKEEVILEPEKPKAEIPKPEKPKEEPKKLEKPKPLKTPKHKKPDERVVKSKTSKSSTPAAPNPAAGAPKDAIERIRQSLAKRGSGSGQGAGDGSAAGKGRGGFGVQLDPEAIKFYKDNIIPDFINRNWAFSEHLTRRRFNLEAVLIIRIMASGEIADIWFERKSGDKYFDDSAYKAVIKSNPLPPLPKGYGPYEVGLRFTPSGMM